MRRLSNDITVAPNPHGLFLVPKPAPKASEARAKVLCLYVDVLRPWRSRMNFKSEETLLRVS